MFTKLSASFKQANGQSDHYPQKNQNSRRCKHCELIDKNRNKKSKYICMGCSKRFQMDFSLCIGCWGEFHEYYLSQLNGNKLSDLQKIYAKSNNINHFRAESGQNERKITMQQVVSSLARLNENMQDIAKMQKQLDEQDDYGSQLLKKTNQFLSLNVVECFNSLINQLQNQVGVDESMKGGSSSQKDEQSQDLQYDQEEPSVSALGSFQPS